jgi:hypothetical protein
MNYILYAFLYDFVQDPLHGGARRLVEYLPFTVMAIVAPLLRLAAWGIHLRDRPGRPELDRSPSVDRGGDAEEPAPAVRDR